MSRNYFYSLFNAFFRFSALVGADPVAALFTALVPVILPIPVVDAIPIPTPIFGFPPPPTFESAVAKGDGETCLSFCGPSFSPARVAFNEDAGAGEDDLRVIVGTLSVPGSFEIEVVVGGEGSDGGMTSTLTFSVVEVATVAKLPLVEDDAGVSLLVEVEEEEATGLSACFTQGLVNSTGLTRGVAWILVMSFARPQ